MQSSPLGNRTYRHLFTAQVIALFGTGLTTIALALLANDLAGERAGEVLGIALAIKMVAYVLIAPVVGAYASKVPRRGLLVALDLVRASVVALLPFVDAVWQIYVLIFLLNACSAGFTPVFQATIPDIIEDEQQYTRALSLSRLAYDLENLLSPTAAALLLAFMSFESLFVLNAVTFLLSAALVLSVVLPRPAAAELARSVWSNVTYGAKVYLRTPRLRGLLALSMAVSAAGAMQIVNTVVYVRTKLELGESDVAIAFAAAGGGSMVVALLLPRLLEKLPQRPAMLTGGLLMTASLFGGTLEPGFAGLLGLWFLLGAGASLVLTPAGRVLKQSCREEDRSALFSAQFSLSHGCWLVAYPLAGWLGANVGLGTAFLILGAIALASTASAARAWPREDPLVITHEHAAQEHEHLHYHDDHHQHEHEGWEGPEPHAHPHVHPGGRHSHVFVVDPHHPYWPV
ncbi:MFS transporter [Ectothiorhodospiraceae bacterium WFHF3C12]|nr:MFS transporter [Ectothiorhodospiraceae bacterium WFHF3C12]